MSPGAPINPSFDRRGSRRNTGGHQCGGSAVERRDLDPLTDPLPPVVKHRPHELKQPLERIESGEVPVADLLLNRISDASIDLLVMGAYGHARVREI